MTEAPTRGFDPHLDAAPDDPSVTCVRWVSEVELDLRVCPDLSAVPGAEALTPEAWAVARAHEAIWCNGHPGRAVAPEGARLAVYTFDAPPPPLDFPVRVLFDASGVVAVDKPARVSTQRTRSSATRCLEARLRAHLGDDGLRAVHRLDRDTSGVVLFARNGPTAGRLHAEFRARRVEKRYLARVSGALGAHVAVVDDEFMVAGVLSRVTAPSTAPAPLRFQLDAGPDGKESHTLFRRLGTRLIEARPVTGRTHQIRVHLTHAGCPIDGDPLYAGRPAERMMLHAQCIELQVDGQQTKIECAAPGCFFD